VGAAFNRSVDALLVERGVGGRCELGEVDAGVGQHLAGEALALEQHPDLLPVAGAAGLLLGYGAALAAAAVVVTMRRDIT
jgi:hypothetical protein